MSLGDASLLLVLFSSLEPTGIEGITRLHKIVYLLKEREEVPFNLHFRQYFHGPHSDDLTEKIQGLIALNLLHEEATLIGV
jgi:uncharacterized protein YwgA